MKLRRIRWAAAAAATVWCAAVAPAQSPNRTPPTYSAVATGHSAVSPDQALADAVAGRLARLTHQTGYSVDILCDQGRVELIGSCQSASQKAELIKAVKTVAGVKSVQDSMTIGPAEGDIEQTQATGSAAPLVIGGGPHHGGSMPTMSGPIPSGPIGGGGVVSGDVGGPMSGPVGGFGGGFGGNAFNDPMPIGPATPGVYDAGPPRLPPYAWPTYAPYNNYSRVGYPTEYPPEAFPFMGPYYPFPKVPLGYRAIKLEWEDGHWWYGRNSTRRDYWKIRYW